MNCSEQPGTQMGVHVSPLFIEGLAMIKLNSTVTSVRLLVDASYHAVIFGQIHQWTQRSHWGLSPSSRTCHQYNQKSWLTLALAVSFADLWRRWKPVWLRLATSTAGTLALRIRDFLQRPHTSSRESSQGQGCCSLCPSWVLPPAEQGLR